ncbi:MAG: hypothetical protein UR69_C0002G0033 [Candidatus Moranbacteria bacterium GW2011_GWE2_35_2-]|nr:MAG: hypothetical protein UR69_C0002G0033 [Candidatus Moranbacteria bacterium GW2011_GWE2_35_2-]KKQ06659.1 MAG: hypothetical protein US15_C0006G0004 [Candidatus Moranbacteria bacterium GW2011_GWF1_36_4]KKQ22618.1 MAG: hypothetical protein US37_C0002G0243 [Candidatus Moranbacteria bacterium GW2011_GWF2_37_11]KKQ29021.1 MAG: hypothetical protein US44_C0004G0065 [Candidatus Moranbacteria bacterium GW2011_GWD1_37_17]KKQ30443.1 MAG: hypothetical protein US47_C0002G0033 [Candidatus Moranbacteria b
METQLFWEPLWLSVPLGMLCLTGIAIMLFLIFNINKKIRNMKGIYRVDDDFFTSSHWNGYYLTTDRYRKAKRFGAEVKLEKGDKLFKIHISRDRYLSTHHLSSIDKLIEKEMPLFKVSIELIFEFSISEEFNPQIALEILALPEITIEDYMDIILNEEIRRITTNQELYNLLEKLTHGKTNEVGLRYQIRRMINLPEIPFKNIQPAGISVGAITLTV